MSGTQAAGTGQTGDLAGLLHARRGIVCVTGAGGKKSLMYALAARHDGALGFTTTVQIPPFRPGLGGEIVVAEPPSLADAVLGAAARSRVVAYGTPSRKPDRVAGVDPQQIARLHREAGFALTLVKADGARGRLVKAPGDDEPLLPDAVDTLIPVLSARAIGRALDERYVHRVDRVATITGVQPGRTLDVPHLARLLQGDDGLLRGAGRASHVVVVINMADDPALAGAAEELAGLALAADTPVQRIVVTCLRRESPVVRVIER